MPGEYGSYIPDSEKESEEVIEVGMDDGYKIIEKGQVGETTGLGPCFGIIIYDPESKKAFVGHFVDPEELADGFEDMIKEAQDLFQAHQEKVQVYIGGGAADPEDAHDGHKKDKVKRKFVEDKLRTSGFKNLNIQYHTSMDNTVLRIDTGTGRVEFDTILFDE